MSEIRDSYEVIVIEVYCQMEWTFIGRVNYAERDQTQKGDSQAVLRSTHCSNITNIITSDNNI